VTESCRIFVRFDAPLQVNTTKRLELLNFVLEGMMSTDLQSQRLFSNTPVSWSASRDVSTHVVFLQGNARAESKCDETAFFE
jgi:hypothetical protein